MGTNKDLKKIKKQLRAINKTLCDLIRYVTADSQMQVGGFAGSRPWENKGPKKELTGGITAQDTGVVPGGSTKH